MPELDEKLKKVLKKLQQYAKELQLGVGSSELTAMRIESLAAEGLDILKQKENADDNLHG